MIFYRKKYINKLDAMKWNGLIKVITGMRRVGKSYLMNKLFYDHLLDEGIKPRNIICFALDSDEDLDLLEPFANGEKIKIKDRKQGYYVNSKVFRKYISSLINEEEHFYLLLDEIQFLENFVGTLNGYLKKSNIDIYVTGSNSKFLSSDVVTEFRGRCIDLHVYPLSFSEYVEGTGEDIQKAWSKYIVTGGIPLVVKMRNETEQKDYLNSLTLETYLKDIIQRNGIRKKQEISDAFNLFASFIGSLVNPTKIANSFKDAGHQGVSSETITRFLDYFSDAFVISRAIKYNIKGRKYIETPFKIYFEDIGIRNSRLNYRQVEETHIMENIIYNELRYRGFNVDVGEINVSENTHRKDVNEHDIYTSKLLEVDFVASQGERKYYIQSALSMSSIEKMNNEKKPLYYIDDSFKKLIVTKNGLAPTIDDKGVITVDLFDFLLKDEEFNY